MRQQQRSLNAMTPLDDRFEMEGGRSSERYLRTSSHWVVTDRDDGETYILWLIKKTGAAVDQDIARFLNDTVRRVRGVLARKAVHEVLLDVIDVIEDDHEIGIRLIGADGSLDALSARSRRKIEESARTVSGRVAIWYQIARLARGVGYLHGADIVHGGIAERTVFTSCIEPLELKLGGYEGCVHLGSVGSGGAALLSPGSVVSYGQDWRDLGEVAAGLLLQNDTESAVLLPAEQRLLDRLRVPPQFVHVEGGGLATEIEALCSELELVGSSGRHELIVLPGRDLLRRDVPALTQGLIPATDREALLSFVQDDLTGDTPIAWRDPYRGDGMISVFTQRAVYSVRPMTNDDRFGRIVSCRMRGAGDGAMNAVPITARMHVSQNINHAQDRAARTGGGAMAWASVGKDPAVQASDRDLVEWHALVLIEVATLLEGRLHHYPVEIVDTPETGLVRVAARTDAERDHWRAKFGRDEAAADLQREMLRDDGSVEWTLTASGALTLGPSAPKLSLEDVVDAGGRRLYVFRHEGRLPIEGHVLLRPRPDKGTETQVRRRLNHIVNSRDNYDLLRAIGDPRSVGLDPAIRAMAPPGAAPTELDPSKSSAWEMICHGHALNLVVGPPGVGKSFLISRLVGSILKDRPTARILITAQNHEALAEMERTLRKHFAELGNDAIVVRMERPEKNSGETRLKARARSLLDTFVLSQTSPLSRIRREAIERLLRVQEPDEAMDSEGEAILRDTEHLILRSADVTLATANSSVLEEMAAQSQQFDWVIVEEAARASGPELIGPLSLGSRRVLIGDHRQLAPFDAERKARLYCGDAAEALFEDAVDIIAEVSDLPEAVGASLAAVADSSSLRLDVLGAALRLEQPFREIAETAEEASNKLRSGPVSMLTEQSRMHPTICELVSETFYGGRLTTAERIVNRACPIIPSIGALAAPLVLFDLPSLSRSRIEAFETFEGTSPANRAETTAVFEALNILGPASGEMPTLAILSPYTAQCNLLRSLVATRIDQHTGLLGGFASPKGDGLFVHTIDSFQGGEADVVIVSTVRNNQKIGRHALGILGDRRRMNVLLSRARHKLVLVTSTGFLRNAIQWSENEQESGSDLGFLGGMLRRIDRMADPKVQDVLPRASIVVCGEDGRII